MSLEPRSQSPLGRDLEPFHCEVRPERSSVRVIAAGELDSATVPLLEAQLSELRQAGFRQLVLDLGQLTFMDSSGLRLILKWDAGARRDGYSLELGPGPPAVQRVFELTGTLALLPWTSSRNGSPA
jgi:anti-anti-sigma factor